MRAGPGENAADRGRVEIRFGPGLSNGWTISMPQRNKKLRPIEDCHDLAVVKQRESEPAVTHKEVLKKLKKSGFVSADWPERLDPVLERMRIRARRKHAGAKDIDREIKAVRSRHRSST